ncbi:hypothetical protein SLE2022_363970 [Rubroshorea leprosula]
MTLDVSFPENAPIDTTPQCPPSNSRFHEHRVQVAEGCKSGGFHALLMLRRLHSPNVVLNSSRRLVSSLPYVLLRLRLLSSLQRHAQDDDEATLEELTKKCSALLEELEAAQKRNDKLKEMLEEDQRRMNLLTRPLDELSIEELTMVTSIADELLEKVGRKKELLVGSAAPAAVSGGESDASIGDPKGETSSADAPGHNNGQDE